MRRIPLFIVNGVWVLALGWGAANVAADTLEAHPDDAGYQTTAAANLLSTTPDGVDAKELYAGRKYYGNTLHHHVVPFELPDLGPGTFTDVQAVFHARSPGYGDSNWDIPINLWAIPGSRGDSATLSTDVRTATQNHLARGRLIMAGYLGRQTLRGDWSESPPGGAESSRLAAWLNDAYQDGTNGGNFVFLRLSPQALTPDEAGPDSANCGFGTGTGSPFVNASFVPKLNYSFTPASLLAPVVATFTVTPDEIRENGAATLTWSVSGADNVTIYPEPGAVAASGSVVINPAVTTMYQLFAQNQHGMRVATAGINVKLPPAPEVAAELYDGTFRTDPLSGAVSGGLEDASENTLYAGRRASRSTLEHVVIPFRLPALGPGIFRNVRLSLSATAGDGTTPGIDLNLFGLPDIRTLPSPLASDVNGGGQDHRTRGVLLQAAWLNDQTPLPGTVVTEAGSPGSAALSAWLTDAYAYGTNAGKYVFVRLSPAQLAVPAATGLRVGSANANSVSERPLLTFEFLQNAPPPPVITSFTAAPPAIPTNWSTLLTWSVAGAESVSLAPGIGNVPASGGLLVSPASTTTYTLTAQNTTGTRSRNLTVGVGPFRWFRFVPITLRGGGGTVQIAEFQMLNGSNRLAGAVASNPGGNNPGPEGPEMANDNLTSTKWLDFNKLPLVLDFGAPTAADGYRLATANDASERDPVSWRIEGSHDGAVWTLLDGRTNYPTPSARLTYLSDLRLTAHPPFRVRAGVASGAGLSLTWESLPWATYTVMGTTNPAVPASWTVVLPNVPAGGNTTTRSLSPAGAALKFFRVRQP